MVKKMVLVWTFF